MVSGGCSERQRSGGKAHDRMRGQPRQGDPEQGSAVIEAVIILPAFMLFVLLIIFGGRLAIARHAVEASAAEAAR
ncbi:MAG TPA: TadE family protein, partial [Propionibacteriaceae bacterium]|nr:TadE family protein [Propionibacteriaceae bacterium]